MQFSLQAASPETFGYTCIVCGPRCTETKVVMAFSFYNTATSRRVQLQNSTLNKYLVQHDANY
jgi:hypothetical protein